MDEKNTFEQKVLSAKDVILYIANRWHIFLLIVIISLIATSVYTFFISSPVYTSKANIYLKNSSEKSKIESNDMNISSYLANDVVEIINDTSLASKVQKRAGKKYSVSKIQSSIKAEKIEGTRIITIKVSLPDPQDATDVADSVCEIAKETCSELMKIDAVNILSYGSLPKKPSTKSDFERIIIGAGIGALTAIILLTMVALNDNRIFSDEDVKKYLSSNVLGTIPYNAKKK